MVIDRLLLLNILGTLYRCLRYILWCMLNLNTLTTFVEGRLQYLTKWNAWHIAYTSMVWQWWCFRPMLNSAASTMTVEQQLKSHRRELQRTSGFTEQKFVKRWQYWCNFVYVFVFACNRYCNMKLYMNNCQIKFSVVLNLQELNGKNLRLRGKDFQHAFPQVLTK